MQPEDMGQRFEPHTLEACLGGSLKGPLFDLDAYAARMKVCAVACACAHACTCVCVCVCCRAARPLQ
jgi:hypothetical protein